MSVGLSLLHFLASPVWSILGVMLDTPLEDLLSIDIAGDSQPHRSTLRGRKTVGAVAGQWQGNLGFTLLRVGQAKHFCAHTAGAKHLCVPPTSHSYSFTVAWSVHDSHVTNDERAAFVSILYYI